MCNLFVLAVISKNGLITDPVIEMQLDFCHRTKFGSSQVKL